MDCVYCRKDVPENKIRFFLRVLLCDDCYNLAYESREATLRNLETLRATFDKTLQDRLISRKPINLFMNFIWGRAVVEDPLLCLTTKHQQPSSASSTKPPVITAGGSESSSKLLVADSRSETESSPETDQ